jgi:hypothetical protein
MKHLDLKVFIAFLCAQDCEYLWLDLTEIEKIDIIQGVHDSRRSVLSSRSEDVMLKSAHIQ